MKKLMVCLLSLLMLFGCTSNKELTDGERFKQEYEAYNGQKDDHGNQYTSIEINADSTIKYATEDNIEELLLRGTHVVYLGWPTCGWCRRAIPVLIDTVNEYSGVNLYVYNIKEARDEYEKGTDSSSAKLYKTIAEAIDLCDLKLDDIFQRYEDGTLKLVSSAVYFVKDGSIVAIHKRTVDSHLDSYEPLTTAQQNELADIYRGYLDEIVKSEPVGCGDCD